MITDEFYIGYEDRDLPREIGRRNRAAVMALASAATAVAAAAVFAAATLPASTFEFGTITEVAGVLRRVPYPVLETSGGRVWLAGIGKAGADPLLGRVADGAVKIKGSRIRRGRHQMLEVHGLTPIASEPEPKPDVRSRREAGFVTLRGEIVDSKCFLGVMNPAEGAVHRDCARRCLSGGLPPLLLVRDGERREDLVVLVAADGAAMSRDVAKVAGRPIEMTGRLVRDGADYVLYVSSWKVLSQTVS
jgi:hypothetical protein